MNARLLESAASAVRVGDDEALEGAFNDFALRAFEATSPNALAALDELLVALSGNAPLEAARLSMEPRGHGLIWSPTGRDRFRVVPWVARALLLKDGRHAFAQGLRVQINCMPFARELLGRCLELEARERAKLALGIATALPPTASLVRLESFLRKDVESDAAYYPNATPARPSDAWAFAEFGAFIDAVMRTAGTSSRRRELHRLRHLRNALAHGHYAGWATLQRLMDIERRLGENF